MISRAAMSWSLSVFARRGDDRLVHPDVPPPRALRTGRSRPASPSVDVSSPVRSQRREATWRANGERLGRPGTPVVVTGGASGIGREVCQALAEVGRPVAPWDLNGAGAKAVADECADRVRRDDVLRTRSTSATPTRSTPASSRRIAALGGVGGLVHAAGISMAPAAHPLDADRVRHRPPGQPAGRSDARAGVPPRAARRATGLGDRRHRVDRRADRPRRDPGVHRVEARRDRPDPCARPRARLGADPGERGVPRLHRDADVRARALDARRAGVVPVEDPDAAARRCRRTSRAWCGSCCPTRPEYIHGSAVVVDGGVTASGGQEFAGGL